jgi:hypothetical protein
MDYVLFISLKKGSKKHLKLLIIKTDLRLFLICNQQYVHLQYEDFSQILIH